MTARAPSLALLLLGSVLAGCTQPAPIDDGPDPPPPRTTVDWRDHQFLGRILTDVEGRTLYTFTRDGPNQSACRDACAATWPPYQIAVGANGPAELMSRLGVTPRNTTPNVIQLGGQVTLDGRPLYRYVGDVTAGQADGQGRNDAWFVVRANEAPGQRNVDFLDGVGAFQVQAANVTYHGGVQGYLASPTAKVAVPGVVMVHEWWGLNEHLRTMARALASHGYNVLAVDLFNGTVATNASQALALVQGLDQDAATANLQAAADQLRAQNTTRVAVLGWCFGGGQALQLAVSGEPLDATVMYYGTPVLNETLLQRLDGPLLGIFAGNDQSIPVDRVQAFERALTNATVQHEIDLIEGVGHAFANPSGNAYAPDKAMAAWARTLDFLEQQLAPRRA